jgi:hypothetical protein
MVPFFFGLESEFGSPYQIMVTNHLTNVAVQTDHYPTAQGVALWSDANHKGLISLWDIMEQYNVSGVSKLLCSLSSTLLKKSKKRIESISQYDIYAS